MRAAAGALAGDDARDVARAVAHDRRGLAVDRGDDELAPLAVGKDLARLRVDDLSVEVVFGQVQTLLFPAFDGNARAHGLGEPVYVEHLVIELLLKVGAEGGAKATAEYAFLQTKGMELDHFTLHGKYSFQYVENAHITNSVLNTKDAFWHGKNITVENSIVRGEYLGWYSENLTLINCHISGTQPLCYCKGLKLINCTMEATDLSFEKSEVEATVSGHILSVKNPESGFITADTIGEIILDAETPCKITVRQ